MTTGGSALVLVQPGDTVEAVAAKARQTGAPSVELLVSADNDALQSRANMVALSQLLAQHGIDLLIISSDARVLSAARQSGLTTIAVEGASVEGPLTPRAPKVLRPQHVAAPARSDEPGDADLLDLLDRGGIIDPRADPPPARHLEEAPEEADFLATLDQLAMADPSEDLPARPSQREGRARQPVADGETRPIPQPSARPPRPSREPRDQPPAARRAKAAESVAPRVSRRAIPDEEEPPPRAAPRRSTVVSPLFIATVLLLIALAAGAIWALQSRVSVSVAAPTARVREEPIVDEAIPYGSQPAGDTPTILAAPVSAEVEYTVVGLVGAQTVSPAGRAQGSVTIINTVEQAINLPEGTEFVGRNQQGAEVRFVVDQALTVPGATTSASLSGRTTTYGQVQVAVTARSPGAASNVPENTVKQILIPGQALIDCGTGNPICQNGPIQGGSDEPQWVVSEADVQRVLGDALTGLYNSGVQRLNQQSVAGQSLVDETTISPGPQALAQPESYEPPIVDPPVGQAADPNSHEFRLTVKTRFTALVVRSDRTIASQMEQVASQHFAQRPQPICSPAEQTRPQITGWTWDGVSLKLSGVVVCQPLESMLPETRLQVRDALRGKSRADAEAALRDLQAQGLIGDFTIPDGVEQLPPLDVLLDVRFVEAPTP
jgi:hypothetical protein